jgi:hypothetical protein
MGLPEKVLFVKAEAKLLNPLSTIPASHQSWHSNVDPSTCLSAF